MVADPRRMTARSRDLLHHQTHSEQRKAGMSSKKSIRRNATRKQQAQRRLAIMYREKRDHQTEATPPLRGEVEPAMRAQALA